MASPKGPEGPGPHHFLTFLKVKAYVGPTIFLGIQGPIIIGPHQFQKRDYTPAIVFKDLNQKSNIFSLQKIQRNLLTFYLQSRLVITPSTIYFVIKMRFLSYQQTEYWKEGIFDFDLLAQNLDILSKLFCNDLN